MKRVGSKHVLYLDIDTDKSHLFAVNDYDHKNKLVTFDSSLNILDKDGKNIGYITSKDGNWIVGENSFGIVTNPVDMNKAEGVFEVETDFCLKWLEKQE